MTPPGSDPAPGTFGTGNGAGRGRAARFLPGGALQGAVRPPADKSISHRAAIIGAMAEGPTRVSNYLDSEDTRSTLAAVASLGAMISPEPRDRMPDEIVIEGVGPAGPRSLVRIDVGNAGTLMRLLPGWLAGCDGGSWRMDGDSSIRRRPVDRVVDPLGLMGAVIDVTGKRFPPIRIDGTRLKGVEYELPMASAQVKSCLLLAGLVADGPVTVIEPVPTRDHTEVMLAAAGARVERDGDRVTVWPNDRLRLDRVEVPGDISSAAFMLVAAALVPGSEVTLERVGINPTRDGIVRILRRMGADIEIEALDDGRGEAIGNVTVRHSELAGTRVDGLEIPLAIDELPLVALAACFAEGETVIADAAELRAKESDRIEVVVNALAGFGAEIESRPDGMRIVGSGGIDGGRIDSLGDHRIAMLGAIAGLVSRDGVTVNGMEAAAISYPGFEDDLNRLSS